MPKYAPQYERSLRLAAVATWASQGLGTPRARFPIEVAFADRLQDLPRPAFRPLALPDSDSVAYHREVSLLIDAFDAFPNRIDLAFDSTWRAFETGLHDSRDAGDQNTTHALTQFALGLREHEVGATNTASSAMPQQAAEFLVARWIEGAADGNKLVRRLANAGSRSFAPNQLRDRMREKYDLDDLHERRNAARLLMLAMRGQPVTVAGEQLELTPHDRALILISGLLFGLRNDRAHGAVPSPFTSSAATLRTFTLPYYAFATTYFLYMSTALRRGHLGSGVTEAVLQQNLAENLDAARDVMGRHWRL